MLDPKFVRENPDVCRKNMKKKFLDPKPVDEFLKIDEKWRREVQQLDRMRRERNELSQKINQAKKAGQDAKQFIKQAKDLPGRIAEHEEKQEKLYQKMCAQLAKIPNIMHASVPAGKDESENKVLKNWGHIKKPGFKPRNHVEICEELGIADFESSASSSGNGFYYIEGGLALLNQALIRFAIDFMHKKGYQYVETPLMLKKEELSASLDVDEFSKTIYELKQDELVLIGTAEHSLLARYKDCVFTEKELPKKVYSYSMCFRKEIGSHGINEKGLWRTHQFNKVEQMVFSAPETSYKLFDEMLRISEEIMQKLKLPYRVLEMCSGDLSSWKAKQVDVEVWRPTIEDYGEVMSLSNCTDYQVRELNIKLDRKGRTEVVHALNNTVLATSRIMVAIIENYQNKDGTVNVPDALVPYMPGKMKVIGKG